MDIAALVGIWLLVSALGPLSQNEEAWLDAIGLVTVPWLVHAFALPSVFHGISLKDTLIMLLKTIAYIVVNGMFIPLVGFAGFCFFAPILLIATGGRPPMPNAPPSFISEILGYGVFAAVVMLVGIGVGSVLHVLRPVPTIGGDHSSPPVVKSRSDVLGAALAACLAFGGMFVAGHFDLFVRLFNDHNDLLHNMAQSPKLPATVIIGVIAFLPHLVMSGRDVFTLNLEQQGDNVAAGGPA
jgi:hypothetical protein